MATWQLDPDTTHLNHASFGATPVEVLQHQSELRAQLEANPVDFFQRRYQPLLEGSRAALASFINADPAGLVFVPNATYGVNSVLRSLEPRLRRGCEIIITNHTYNACRNAAAETAQRVGGTLVVADIPFPLASPSQAASAVLDAVTPETALVVLDHVTSATGLVLPIEEIAADLEPDVTVLIDGAHAPGMVEVDISAIGASFYTANCHKWICSPKGAGFVWVDDYHRPVTRAAVVSHGYNDGWPGSESTFHAQFDWTGTDDPTARLCVGTALQIMDEHRPGGWSSLRASNHELVLEGRSLIAHALRIKLPAPDNMIGSIASLQIPEHVAPGRSASHLVEWLHTEWAVEVPISPWPTDSDRLLRISGQQYNLLSDYERLASALLSFK